MLCLEWNRGTGGCDAGFISGDQGVLLSPPLLLELAFFTFNILLYEVEF